MLDLLGIDIPSSSIVSSSVYQTNFELLSHHDLNSVAELVSDEDEELADFIYNEEVDEVADYVGDDVDGDIELEENDIRSDDDD